MLLHGAYPVPLEERVLEALDSVRPYMESHGGDVDLVGIDDGVARLRLQGSCSGCAASLATLEQAIETALEQAAPDLLGIDVEGAVAPRAPTEAPAETHWVELDGVGGLARGATTSNEGLMVANVAGTLLAYRDHCAGCPAPLHGGMLVGGKLTCTGCGRTYDLPRAGRCVDDAALQLDPVPLLRNGGPVRVALPREEPVAHEAGHCELCPIGIGEDHRHLLHLVERRIVCVCETCWSLRSGDPEFRPPGARSLMLEDFTMSDAVWSEFQIPVGLSFLLRSSVTGGVVAMYPSPAGATESELDLSAWDSLVAANPSLEHLEPDAEALIVDRTGDEHRFAIVPVDQSYRLVGLIKSRWEGITGGRGVDEAIDEFFAGLR
jgi:Fe-S cluster biogenesis protein NfuA/nitrite reductase/ring-hydroxylating ferredoxin subunit